LDLHVGLISKGATSCFHPYTPFQGLIRQFFKAGEVNLWYGYKDLAINRLPEMIRKGQKKTKFTEQNTLLRILFIG
jgi:hypothetical protein